MMAKVRKAPTRAELTGTPQLGLGNTVPVADGQSVDTS